MRNLDVRQLSANIATNTVQYAANDVLGGLLTIENALNYNGSSVYEGQISKAVIQDLTTQGATISLVLFNANPDSSTFTNNSVIDIHDDDLSKVLGVIHCEDAIAFNDNGIIQAIVTDNNIPYPISSSGSTLYVVPIVKSGTPTYVANALTLKLEIESY